MSEISEIEIDSDTDSIDIELAAEKALASLLPEKSKGKYEKAYNDFKAWCGRKKVDAIDEKSLLVELKEAKCSTAWSIYSMLKSTLYVKENIDLKGYNNLRALLKRKSTGYQPKKSRILSKAEIYKFIKEAPDSELLVVKVALIIGVYGACRRDELVNLTLDQIEYMNNPCGMKVTLPKTKTNIVRQFVICEGDDPALNLIEVVTKYSALRPANVPIKRFFLCYRNGKCTRQPIGIHTIGGYPQKIASYLNLKNPAQYTGHCFRRSPASLLADSGANISVIKRLGGWVTDRTAEGILRLPKTINGK